MYPDSRYYYDWYDESPLDAIRPSDSAIKKQHLLNQFDCREIPTDVLDLPPRQEDRGCVRPADSRKG